GFHEGSRSIDRTIDVTFRREVHHAVDLFLAQQSEYEVGVGDVAFDEAVVRRVVDHAQRREVAGISQLIEIDYAPPCANQAADDRGTDEAGAAGDEYGPHPVSLRIRTGSRSPRAGERRGPCRKASAWLPHRAR